MQLRLEKRPEPSRAMLYGAPVFAVLLTMVVGAILFSLIPENQRYFDYHHSANDTIDKVNPRELEMGALAMASLCWLLSEDGDRLGK